MQPARKVPWSRVLAESAIIVSSILLAFAIDAWWEKRSEQKLENTLLIDLRTDFEASQAHIEDWLEGNRKVLRATRLFLERLRSATAGEPVEIEFEWIVAAISAPTYSPTDSSLRAAAASGLVEKLQDPALRKALAAWRQQLDDTQEDELLARNLVVGQVVPLLGEQVRLGRPFEFDTVVGWFTGGIELESGRQVTLNATTELEAALAQRVFYETFVVEGLAGIRETQSGILELLERNIGNPD